jgi:DNA-binding beta-propeller fold protein YncE
MSFPRGSFVAVAALVVLLTAMPVAAAPVAALAIPGWMPRGPDGAIDVSDGGNGRPVRVIRPGPRFASAAAGATPAAPSATANAIAFQWAAMGDPNHLLYLPLAIALDPHGTLWATDAYGQFQLFAPDGTYLETWGTPGTGDGQFNFVRPGGDSYGGVAFAPDGSFDVVDTGNLRVQQFDKDRHFVKAWGGQGTGEGQFREPLSIAIDGQDQLYVLDDLRDDVQVFDGHGAWVRTFRVHAAFGLRPNQKNSSNQLALDGAGNVYVTSVLRSSVLKFSPRGTLLAEIGGPGTGDGRFGQPIAVAVDGHGNLFVSDGPNYRIEVFAPDGTYVMQWGSDGVGPGQFIVPAGIAVRGPDVYVADYLDGRVQKFRLTGPLTGAATPAP